MLLKYTALVLLFLTVASCSDTTININFDGLLCTDQPDPCTNPCTPPNDDVDIIQKATKTVEFLHYNDVYILEGTESGAFGGVARAKTIINTYPEALVIFSGDCFSPSSLSTVFGGQQMVDTFNELGLTLAVAGNHEFDKGIEHAESLFKQSNYPWLLANIVEPGTTTPIAGLGRSLLVEKNGMKIGFFGIASDWRFLTGIGAAADFIDIIEISKQLVAELKAEGADLIVAVTHNDYVDDLDLVAGVPGIDVVLGGHDHDLADQLHKNGIIIWKSKSDLSYMGHLTARVVTGVPDPVTEIRTALYPLDPTVALDPTVDAIVQDYLSKFNDEFETTIGIVKTPLVTTESLSRSEEINFGNYLCDIILEKITSLLNNPNNYPVVAVYNGGAIRSNTVYPVGHNFTKKDVIDTLPFGNTIGARQITGAILREALENSVSAHPTASGRFLQISGFKYEFRNDVPVGSRVVSITYPNGDAVKDDDIIIFASISYLLTSGGDGYDMFDDSPLLIDPAAAQRDDGLVMDYITANPEIDAKVEGRVVIVSNKRNTLRNMMDEFSLDILEEELVLARQIKKWKRSSEDPFRMRK